MSHTTTSSGPAHAAPTDTRGRHAVVTKAALFVAGCILLILAAANLDHLGEWSQRWGQVPVFLGFFLLMSIAGRWFWTGADAILGKVVGSR